MQIYYTNDATSQFSNIFVYGLAGSGKTPLASTAPNPIIISSEPGLKSLQRYKLPYIIARNHRECTDAHKWVIGSNEARHFQTVYFDSISAASETITVEERRKSLDARKFSPAITNATMEIVLLFLSIKNKHVVMTSKAIEKTTSTVQVGIGETSNTVIEPFAAMPKLGPMLPYHFDDVLYLSRFRNAQTGAEMSALCCRANDNCVARNRSGMLDLWEPADITHIIRKSNGVV